MKSAILFLEQAVAAHLPMTQPSAADWRTLPAGPDCWMVVVLISPAEKSLGCGRWILCGGAYVCEDLDYLSFLLEFIDC